MRVGGWLAAKAAILVTVIAYVAGSWWFTELLANRRPAAPSGRFVVPFKQHGGMTYVTPLEHGAHIALIVGGVLLVLAWWTVEHFEKRSKTR